MRKNDTQSNNNCFQNITTTTNNRVSPNCHICERGCLAGSLSKKHVKFDISNNRIHQYKGSSRRQQRRLCYTGREIESFRKSNNKQQQNLRCTNISSSSSSSTSLLFRKQFFMQFVLQKQRQQIKLHGFIDTKQLAESVSKFTKEDVVGAQARAIQDEQDARKVYSNEYEDDIDNNGESKSSTSSTTMLSLWLRDAVRHRMNCYDRCASIGCLSPLFRGGMKCIKS